MTRLADRWIYLAYSHSEIRSFKMKVVERSEWISLKRSNTRVNSFEFGFFCSSSRDPSDYAVHSFVKRHRVPVKRRKYSKRR